MSDGDLVERVATAMRVAFEAPIREADEWRPLARYALDLATRAAREGALEAWDSRGDDPPGFWTLADFPAEEARHAVRRAVEGS